MPETLSGGNTEAVAAIAAITGQSVDGAAEMFQARPDDRRAVRRALRHLPAGHRVLRMTEDPDAVHAFLTRLTQPPR